MLRFIPSTPRWLRHSNVPLGCGAVKFAIKENLKTTETLDKDNNCQALCPQGSRFTGNMFHNSCRATLLHIRVVPQHHNDTSVPLASLYGQRMSFSRKMQFTSIVSGSTQASGVFKPIRNRAN